MARNRVLGILLLECLVLYRYSQSYPGLYSYRPNLASAIASIILSAIGETLGQTFRGRLLPAKIGKFMIWGGITAPITRNWLGWLTHNVSRIPLRVLMDQLLFSPFLTMLFFLYSSIYDDTSFDRLLRTSYFPTLRASYTIWPLFSLAAFYYIPPHLQVPMGGVLGICWTMYLGLTAS